MSAFSLFHVCLCEDERHKARPLIEQIFEHIRLFERDLELMVRQFSRTVLGMNVHGRQSASSPIKLHADPATIDTGINGLPTSLPGMESVTQLTGMTTAGGTNPLAVLQQLFMGIIMQFQSLIRTLTAIPGTEILGR